MADLSRPALRVALLTHGGAEKVLESLAALEGVQVVGVFVETEVLRTRPFSEKLKRSVRYDGYAATFAKLARKVFSKHDGEDNEKRRLDNQRDQLAEIARACNVPFHLVADYHSAEGRALIEQAGADLGVICGTNILRESVFSIPRLGSINLHQGHAPLYRGGPPIFWELFNAEREVGLTVHFVAAKVDSGDILLQETVPLEYDYSRYGTRFESFLDDYGARLSKHSATLVATSVGLIASGKAERQPQDVSQGKRYCLPTKEEKDELRRRLRERHRAEPRHEQTGESVLTSKLRARE